MNVVSNNIIAYEFVQITPNDLGEIAVDFYFPIVSTERLHRHRAVGIAAIKYADLSSDLVRDYVFDMDRMVAFEGHTGP